jgi:general secretion pathway protein D
VMHLPRAAAWLVVTSLLSGACASGALKEGQAAEDLQDYDLAVARYTRAVRERPDDRDAQQRLERARLRAAAAHLIQGRRLVSIGRHEDAVVELQLAAELNPTNPDAEKELRAARLALRAALGQVTEGKTTLETLIARSTNLAPAGPELAATVLPSTVTTPATASARSVYLLVAKLTNISIAFDAAFRDVSAPVSLRGGMTVRQALDAVSAASNSFYQVIAPNTIIVVTDTPAKRREYTEEVVRQFTVQNVDLKEAADALRQVTDARYTAQITGINTLLVRDTPERIAVIGRFLQAFDKAKPEVVVNVEVLEVDRTKMKEYGLQIASPGSTGIDGAVDVNREGGLTLQSLRSLGQADVFLSNLPALYYRLIKTDGRTRTLASPHLRALDGVQAVARFGQDVPVPRLTVAPITQGGVNIQPQTQFEYRTVGVNIAITPRTHPNDDVTLALNIELSSVGAPGFDGLPTFGSRNVATSIRLHDGETNILAGLIREDERTERQTVPGLGDIPVLGPYFFSRNRRDAQQTDVVIMLTPHVLRPLQISEEDLRPLRLPRDGATGGGIIIEPQPIVVPPPIPAPARPTP